MSKAFKVAISKKIKRRYKSIVECEVDMRCCARDMSRKRLIEDEIEKINHHRLRGRPIDEVRLARLISDKKKISANILIRWDRLYRQMTRIRAEKEKIQGIFVKKEATHGNA